MKRVALAVVCVCAGLLLVQSVLVQSMLVQSVHAQSTPHQNVFIAGQFKYGPTPPSLAAGAEMVVLEGDPMANTGDYTVRLKMLDGYKIAPHWHPKRENVTVMVGSLKVGMGDKFDESKMTALPPGSFAYLDPDMHHYAMASGVTVIQVHGMSPLQINYVNPADDPSKK